VSPKSRIREAQREAAKRLKPASWRDGENASATISSKSVVEDEIEGMAPTVEEIRITLLRKSTNGKKTQ
jgi:hypothetical protein